MLKQLPHHLKLKGKKKKKQFFVRFFLLLPAQNEKNCLVEGVWSLGGEAGFVLATQDPVRQRELDLGVLQEETEETSFSFTQTKGNHTHYTLNPVTNHLSPGSEPPDLKTEAGNLEEESGFSSARVLKLELTNVEAVQRETRHADAKQETECGAAYVELLDGRSATLVGEDDLHLHDLDGVGASTMASSHITI